MPPRPEPRPVGKEKKKLGKPKAPRLSPTRKPDSMSLEDWQIALRRQFGREQNFLLERTGEHPIFSTFRVTNPASGNTYDVRIRGGNLGDNACSCPDFATNALGTCKHLEFTLARLERKRDGRALLKAGHQPAHSEVYLQYGSRREVRFRPGTDCPVELARLASRFFDEVGALRAGVVDRFDRFVTDATALEAEIEIGDDVLAYVAELRDARRREQLVEKTFPHGVRSEAFDGLLKVDLYDYQREGALFAARSGRALIGDEMGLGKTIQAIAAAEILARLSGVERVLVVCPTSLKHQWQREIERFTDRTAGVVSGQLVQRRHCFEEAGHFFKIANYDTVHADLDAINSWSPDLVILDEAQRIKNWTTRVARSVKKIDSPHAIVLTGTPLENRLEELISIVQFIDLFRLGPTYRLLHNHQLYDEVGKVIGYRDLDKLGQTLAPILIRRQKEQVLKQLPGRIDTTIFVPMTEQQRALHADFRDAVARIVQKWRRFGFLTEKDKQRLMAGLQGMRMSCDDAYLVDAPNEHGSKADEVVTLLDELLERDGTKVVVFSQWLKMHELIVKRLNARGEQAAFFHGGLTSDQRKTLVDRFRNDPECKVFLSTDAGSVGLNLQHASVIINVDLPWNPAILEQRIGRVHRMGQTQGVRVVNFVSKGGIEEGMLNVLKFKKSLFEGVLDGGEKEVFLGGSRLTKFIETVEAATTAIPEPVPVESAPEPEPEPTPEAGSPPAPAAKKSETERAPVTPAPTSVAPADPWSGLLQAGMALLSQFAAPAKNGESVTTAALPGRVCRDEQTGESYLRLPVPPPEVIQQAVGALAMLLQSMQQR